MGIFFAFRAINAQPCHVLIALPSHLVGGGPGLYNPRAMLVLVILLFQIVYHHKSRVGTAIERGMGCTARQGLRNVLTRNGEDDARRGVFAEDHLGVSQYCWFLRPIIAL